jgi:two-component system phosphate regulon sensor histidine kinase PhoR
MIRMASHDLRTPLSRIIFSSAMMEPEVAPGSMQEELLNTIKEAATQMQSLLEDILNLERIESSEVSEQHPIDVVNLIRKVCDSFHQQAAMHSQSFIVDLPENAVIVVGSEVQLREAYSNLIGNAFKYTPDGGTVTVRASTNANRLNFEVEDTGYGIPPERQEKIFKRFYRAHTPGTEAIPGTGLGLSLVKTVIERHGGEVWFRSQLAVGSVFGCWVPLQPA